MAATLAAFTSILKEFYLGPIQDQLNEETLVCDMFEKASVDWNGRQVIIPVHIGRNANVGWVGEGLPLPGPQLGSLTLPAGSASQQVYGNLTVTSQFLYGRFQVTGPAVAAAGKGGANSFVGWVDAEMNKLVNDIKVNSNRVAVSGGDCIGFITHPTAVGAGAGVDALWDGDTAKMNAIIADGIQDAVALVRLDTYATVSNQLTVAVPAAGTVAGGNVQLQTGGGGAIAFATDAAGGAIPCAVCVTAAGIAGATYAALGTAQEPVGIYGNLGLPGTVALPWFPLTVAGAATDRTTATATAEAMQCGDGVPATPTSNCMSAVTVANTPAGVTMPQLQSALDRLTLASDSSPDVILVNPLQRTRIAAQLQGAFVFNSESRTKATAVDGGYTGFSFAGIPIKTSRHVDNGLALLLDTKSWKMCELESGKFADEDGNVLARVGILDAWEGFYKWYYNLVCTQPNRNAVITGLQR